VDPICSPVGMDPPTPLTQFQYHDNQPSFGGRDQ
jgi:hypothetical protein